MIASPPNLLSNREEAALENNSNHQLLQPWLLNTIKQNFSIDNRGFFVEVVDL